MNQLTIRGFEPELERRIREMAGREGTSLNKTVLRLLRKATGVDVSQKECDVVGCSLDHLIGSWSSDNAREIMEAVADFESIDEGMWK